jgi:hypothetical protein
MVELSRAKEGKWIMKTQDFEFPKAALFLAWLLLAAAPLRAQPYFLNNLWANPGSGKWEVASNWSAGTAPGVNDNDQIYIGTTVTIDATTSGSFSNTMTVSYVTLAAPTVTLELVNAGINVPLHVLWDLDITDGSLLVVTNSALLVNGVTTVGDLAGEQGSVRLDSGWAGFGSVTLGVSGNGDLHLDGASLAVAGTMTLGSLPGSGGIIQMSGGTLINTNNPLVLGGQGDGTFNMSGGSVQALGFLIGNAAGSQGNLAISGGNVLVSSNILVGNAAVTNPCGIVVSSNSAYGTVGGLTVTNAAGNAFIGVAHNGSLTLKGGILHVDNLILTNGGTFTNLSGTFELAPALTVDNGGSVVLAGGVNHFDGGVTLGSTNGGTGSLTLLSNSQVTVSANFTAVSGNTNAPSIVTVLSGSSLTASNGTMTIGSSGSGLMTISGGTVRAQKIHLGGAGAFGKVVFDAGFVSTSELLCNWWVGDGGDQDGNGGTMILGAASHDSLFQLDSGASTNWGWIYVGYGAGLTGTITNDGGVMSVTNELIVGDCVTNSTGVVSLSGSGSLSITNAAHNAVLDVRKGAFIMSGGTLVVDILRITNACGGTLSHSGGTLQYGQLVLDPNQSAVGDGIPNGWKQYYGLDPLDPSVAGADPDHDGARNLAEYLAGTNPTNAASVFRMVDAVVTNHTDIRIDWTTVGGHRYVVQTKEALNQGIFADSSGAISVAGTGESTTNYIQAGAATNPANFYRVRLQQ